MSPLVSVVIPCYNYGQYVEEAVDSCLASTFQDIEIIVVNNGSTDAHTNNVLARLNRPKTRVLRIKRNIGLPYGRNFGIRHASGTYILPLDADDKIHPALIEKSVRRLEAKPEVGFVTSGMAYFGDERWTWMPPPFDLKLLTQANIVLVCSMFRKKAWAEVGGYNEKMLDGYEDWDFWLSLAEKGWKGDTIQEILFFYRRHGRSMAYDAGLKHHEIVARIRANHPKLFRGRP